MLDAASRYVNFSCPIEYQSIDDLKKIASRIVLRWLNGKCEKVDKKTMKSKCTTDFTLSLLVEFVENKNKYNIRQVSASIHYSFILIE